MIKNAKFANDKSLLKENLVVPVDGLSSLAMAVIQQACEDWCWLYKHGSDRCYRYNGVMESIHDLEDWFHGDEFIFWSSGRLDPDSILKQLRKNCDERKHGLYGAREVERMISQKKQLL